MDWVETTNSWPYFLAFCPWKGQPVLALGPGKSCKESINLVKIVIAFSGVIQLLLLTCHRLLLIKKTIKVNELKKNCWNSVCRVFQTKSKLLTWRFVAKRATELTSATTGIEILMVKTFMILYFAYWGGEQIEFLKKVNKEQDFKIHYISFVCKERCLDLGLAVWIFVR